MFLKKVIHQIGRQIFIVGQIKNTEPTTYLLKDYQNKPISGCFYEQELAKVTNSDVYLIEKILKKRGNKLCVKWLGFDNSPNSWIDNNSMFTHWKSTLHYTIAAIF